jgi:hypothetical protein
MPKKKTAKESLHMDATAEIHKLKVELKNKDDQRIKENTGHQAEIQKLKRQVTDLGQANKSLATSLGKAKEATDKVKEAITFMEGAGFIDVNGNFIPPKKWQFWVWFQIAEFLITWIPQIIAIFKKK